MTKEDFMKIMRMYDQHMEQAAGGEIHRSEDPGAFLEELRKKFARIVYFAGEDRG